MTWRNNKDVIFSNVGLIQEFANFSSAHMKLRFSQFACTWGFLLKNEVCRG
jgi:hypothetical protein